jgi:hypothetical protein
MGNMCPDFQLCVRGRGGLRCFSPRDMVFLYAPNHTKTSESSVFYLLDESPSKQQATGIIFTLSRPSLPSQSETGHGERRSGRMSAYWHAGVPRPLGKQAVCSSLSQVFSGTLSCELLNPSRGIKNVILAKFGNVIFV